MTAAVTFYAADVFHARLRPHPHRFRYKALAMAIDLDRLAEAGRASQLFSVGRFNLASFRPGDHGRRDGTDLRTHIEALTAEAGAGAAPARILLQCFPRLAGFGFNPLSIYHCLDGQGRLVHLVYEVRNTFGESHSYVAAAEPTGDGARPHRADKLFYVSPFMDMALNYTFHATIPGERLATRIIVRDGDGPVLTAMIAGEAIEPRPASLLAAAFRAPLLGLSVLAGIHWEAAKLFLKGHRIRRRLPHGLSSSFEQPGAYSARLARSGAPDA